MTQWKTVASLSDFAQTPVVEVMSERSVLILVKHDDQVFAYQGLCPHQFARLAGGTVDSGTLTCPHHLARFDIATGVCTGGWQLPPLKRYAIRITNGEIQLPEPLIAID